MKRKILYFFVVAILASCSNDDSTTQGAVVKKEYKPATVRIQHIGSRIYPQPIPEKYILYIRDSSGKIRPCRVDMELYDVYEIGDWYEE